MLHVVKKKTKTKNIFLKIQIMLHKGFDLIVQSKYFLQKS
jgi:hypothetical protein